MEIEDFLFKLTKGTPGLIMPNGDAIESSDPEEELTENDQLITAQGNHLDANLRNILFEVSTKILEELREPYGLPEKSCELDRLEQLSRVFAHMTASADEAMKFFEGD